MIRVCIFGASGFVGKALTERLLSMKDVEVKAVTHDPANSWPVLRLGIPICHADLNDISSIDLAINGCTHVVNCTLGLNNQMIKNIENLILSCRRQNIVRLVHLSSITVYGELPHKDSRFESGPVQAKRKSYGWYKSKQDKLLEKANRSGLSAVVLCPPHITGAYGRIFHQVIDGIKKGSFALVDNGKYPCNLVDVNNLCHAIELALFIEKSDGKRIFITNDDDYTWNDLAEDAARLAGTSILEIPGITADQAKSLTDRNMSVADFTKNILRLQEVKDMADSTILKRNANIYNFIRLIYKISGFKKSSNSTPIKANDFSSNDYAAKRLDPWLSKQQLRNVRHKNDRAREVLGYKPLVNSKESFKIFEAYYSELYGYGSEYWHLQKNLDYLS
jgi:nucleoside-diphosphate-sugar epimerase